MSLTYTYAIIEHQKSYEDFYLELLNYIKARFSNVQSGLQGDAWIWIIQDGQKVILDTFHSMKFEIKSEAKNEFLESVIDHVQQKYNVRIFDVPIER